MYEYAAAAPPVKWAITLLTPKKQYARAGALRMFSNSLNTLLVPRFRNLCLCVVRYADNPAD